MLNASGEAADFRKMKGGTEIIRISGPERCFVKDRGWTYHYGHFYADLVGGNKEAREPRPYQFEPYISGPRVHASSCEILPAQLFPLDMRSPSVVPKLYSKSKS